MGCHDPYAGSGQQYDEVAGLYSLRAQYYDPSDGRFLSRDTYATNNPVTNYDPSGQSAFPDCR
ncbi:MAG: hypothetical protein F9K27_14445 [Anaerolineae bacterium]|nr:MAG: hypothetical protein F9K27_14445 [Anaerolineae bacterium]